MPGTTTNWGFRYPTGSDSPQAAVDMANLAGDVDTSIAPRSRGKIQFSAVNVSNNQIVNSWNFWETSSAILRYGMTSASNGLIVPADGDYLLICNYQYGTTVSGRCGVWLMNNGAEPTPVERDVRPASSDGGLWGSVSAMFPCNSGDVLGALFYQDSGGVIAACGTLTAIQQL